MLLGFVTPGVVDQHITPIMDPLGVDTEIYQQFALKVPTLPEAVHHLKQGTSLIIAKHDIRCAITMFIILMDWAMSS